MIKKEAKRIALIEIINQIAYMEISKYRQDRLNNSELEKVNKKNDNFLISLCENRESGEY